MHGRAVHSRRGRAPCLCGDKGEWGHIRPSLSPRFPAAPSATSWSCSATGSSAARSRWSTSFAPS